MGVAARSRFSALLAALCFASTVYSVEISTPFISLDQAVHFTTPDGSDVHLSADSYGVEQAGDSSLRLFPSGGLPPVVILAGAITHEEPLTSPLALPVLEEGQDDQVHLILLLPRGGGLDAIGSYSGTRSRAAIGTSLSRMQVQSAVGQIRVMPPPPAVQPAPPAYVQQPAAVVRVPGASAVVGGAVTGPAVDLEDTGVIDIVGDFVGPVSWGYLRMNAPEVVVGMIQEVQAGRMNPNML